MGGGSGGTSTSGNQFGFQNSTSTTTPDPNAYNYILAGLNMGSNVAGIPYQPYTGQTVAGFSQDQLAAMQGVRNAVGQAQPYIDQATQLAANAYNLSSPGNFSQAAVGQYLNPLMNEALTNLPITYSQGNISQYYDPRIQDYLNTAPMTFSADAVQKYYNPYQQNVINTTNNLINQQNAQQLSQQQAQAIQSGAFGGDRSGAARSQLIGQQNLAQQQTEAQLEQQGYSQALAAFQQQQAQALGAATQQQTQAQSMFNQQQAAGLNARQQAYAQAVAEYNQQQQQAIQAAQQASYGVSQLGAQSQQSTLQGLQALLGTGQVQQQQQQQQLNQDYSKWLAAMAYPYQQLAMYSGVAGLAPGLGSTTNTQSYGYGNQNQQQSGGSSLGQAAGLATSLLGLFSASDERAKTNIDYYGKDPQTGDNLYAYDYKSDVKRAEETGKPMPPKRISPMAQEVAEKRPEDVVDLGGLLGVKLGREGRASGGVSPSSSTLGAAISAAQNRLPTTSASIPMQGISTYTGELEAPNPYTDLSSIAYPTNPNLSDVGPSGLSALFTPYEEYKQVEKHWLSPKSEDKEVELEPFEVKEKSRSKKADGGSADPTDYFQMSKTLPFGAVANPKVTTALAALPTPDFPLKTNPTQDLGFVPGVPGGAKGFSKMEVPESGLSPESIKKLASAGKKAYSHLGSLGSSSPVSADTVASDTPETSPKTETAPATEAASPESGFSLGNIGGMFGGLFKDGGRAELASGGIATGNQINPLTNYFGSGLTTNYPVTLAGQAAFNTPINKGPTVLQAFGGGGLGRPISSSLANFRLPWNTVNTGSSAYNNLLLQAAKNVGPRQLTPQEFGLPAINSNFSNLNAQKTAYPSLPSSPTNYTYQMTDTLTPEGTYFEVPVSSYYTPQFYVNPFATTAPTFKSHGGSVRQPHSDGERVNQDFDLGSLGIMDTNPGDVSSPYVLNSDMYSSTPGAKSLGELPLTAFNPETNKITEVKDGSHPAIETTAVSHPNPHTHVMAQKKVEVKPHVVAKDREGFDLGELLSGIFGGGEHKSSKHEHPFGWDNTGSLQGFDLQDLIKELGLRTGGRAGYALEGAVEDNQPTEATGDDYIDKIKEAIAGNESRGHKDPYRLVGPRSPKGDFPYGKFQVMGANIPSWTEEAGLGRMTPQQFLASDEAQEKVASHKLGQYYKKTGSPEKAAAMWFGGPGYASHPNARDVLGTSIPQYTSKFLRNLGESGNAPTVVASDRPRVAEAEAPRVVSPTSKPVASDAGVPQNDSGDFLQPLRHALGGDRETEPGLFGYKPLMNRDLSMFLLATGAGMAASRNRSPIGAFGEGALGGIEAMQASRAGREGELYKNLQAQNLLSEIQKRNFELNELSRRARARQQLLGGETVPGAGPAASDRGVEAPPAMVEAPKAPDIVQGGGETPVIAPTRPEGIKPAAPVPTGNVVQADPYDTEIAAVTAEEQKNRALAERAQKLGIPEEAKPYEDRAANALERRRKLMEDKRKSLTEKVDETSPMGIYRQGQQAAMNAQDNLGSISEIEQIISNPKVDFGVLAPYISKAKSMVGQGEDYFPKLKEILPTVDKQALASYERLEGEGAKLILLATNGKLGGGVTDADVRMLRSTTYDPSRSREYNYNVMLKQEALQKKVIEASKEAEAYKEAHGGIDTNFQSHMAKWGQEHPVQSFMRKEAERKAGQIGQSSEPVAQDRTIVKRGTHNGKPVVQYSDGTIEYAN